MKIFIVTILLVAQQSAFAFLSPHQQTQAVKQLNDICADAWCESSFDFVFQKIVCSLEQAQCLLEFTTQENFSPNQPIVNGQCLFTAIQSQEQIFDYIESTHSGAPISFLKASFIDQVNHCLADYMK